MAKVARIAVPVPLRRTFDYLMPAGHAPIAGIRCAINFSGREMIGVIIEPGEPPADGNYKLKPVRKIIDETPVIDHDILALCHQAAAYYMHPLGEVFFAALPTLLRQGGDTSAQRPGLWRLTDQGRHARPQDLTKAPRQRQALELLGLHPGGAAPAMLSAAGATPAALKSLAHRGWAELVAHVPPTTQTPDTLLGEVPLTAEPQQAAAIRAISSARGFTPFLLDGVTGSGKTEVYLQAMAEHLHEGHQILVLVPEIGLTPQTVRRFSKRFRVPIALLHSGLSDRERLDAWLDARDGRARIVLGTRSAIFTPMPDLGLVIVDEAHDVSFKQQDGFRYSARDLAVLRARIRDIPVVLGTATPALETLHQVEIGRYRHLRMDTRAGSALPPRLVLEDCRALSPDAPLSDRSLRAISHALDAQRQVLVFLNRRGYAPMLLCSDCGWQAQCGHCDVFMTWHRQDKSLRCHHCGAWQRIPLRCPACGSPHLRDLGSGTEKLEQVLSEAFPTQEVIRIDRDTTRRKGSMDRRLNAILQGKPAILVGTQMLAKGHHFSHLDLAVILDADAGFLSADFKGPEQASQLLLQVAGRTGRSGYPGLVIIQTRNPDNPLLHLLLSGDYHQIATRLLEERRAIGLPPYGHMAIVRCEAQRAEDASHLLETVRTQSLERYADGFVPDLLGPVPAPLERRSGRYRYQLVVLSRSRPALHRMLKVMLELLEESPLARRSRWSLDVDPVDMM